MKLPYLCLSCDPAQNWKRQLECSWRRKLLILLGDVQKLESIEKEKLENLKNKLDTIEHLDQLNDELSKVYSQDLPISVLTPHQKLLSELFPFYAFESKDEHHQVSEAFEEFPSEFSFHRKIAPLVPSFSTPSFYSPPCSFCTAKPAYCRMLYLGQDEWCHLACAMWVGIRVTSSGKYSDVLRGLSQGLGSSAPRETESCRHCGYSIKSSIAAKCQSPGCDKSMHFYCAKIVGWSVTDKYNTFCGRHKPKRPLVGTQQRQRALEIKKEPPTQSIPSSDTAPVTPATITRTQPASNSMTSVETVDQKLTPAVAGPTRGNSLDKKTGKPAQFEKMMMVESDKTRPEVTNQKPPPPLLFPTNRAPPPKPQLQPAPQKLTNDQLVKQNTPQNSQNPSGGGGQIDPQKMATSILSARPDFTPTEQNQLHKLIDSLFKEETEKPHIQSTNQNPSISSLSSKSTNQAIVTYAQSPNLNRSLKPEVQSVGHPSRSLPVLHSRPATSAQNNPTQISPSNQIRPLPTLQNMSKQPLPAQPQTSTTPITTPLPTNQNAVQLNTSPKEKTPILSSLLKSNLPQYDGLDEDAFNSSSEDEEVVKKKKKKKEEIPLEDIFRRIEENFIPRGRARPDHNDQAHHWKSKWAKGVCPSDLYIAIGGCSINNIGKIHPDASQKFKKALFPSRFEASKYFWSVENPGNIVKYILNVSVLHVPPPPETYQNVTQRQNEDILLFFKPEEKENNCEMISSEKNNKTEEFTFEYDDFEMAEVELEEILPPPLPKHLQARKRSAESQEEEFLTLPQPSNKRPRRNKKRGQKHEEFEDITEEIGVESAKTPAEVLLTDDEDTEDLNVRRSVRVWSNKIKKELVEEVLPDEIDGWKIPTDDEELEGDIEDKFDESFELEKRVPKLKSQTVGKFKRANSSEGGNSSGKSSRKSSSENIHGHRSKDGKFMPKKRGRGRPKRIIDTDSDDEEFNRAREEVLDDVIEHLGSNFEANQLDSDDERPNNVEIISIDEMKNRFISEEEETSSSDQQNQLKSPSLSEDQTSVTSKTDKDEAEMTKLKEEPVEAKPEMKSDLQVITEKEEPVEAEIEETDMESPSALKSPEMLLKSPGTSSPTEGDTEVKSS